MNETGYQIAIAMVERYNAAARVAGRERVRNAIPGLRTFGRKGL